MRSSIVSTVMLFLTVCVGEALVWAEPAAAEMSTPTPPNDVDLVRAADLALQGGRLVEARALLEEIEEQGTAGDTRVALLRAELLVASGHPVEARESLAALSGLATASCRVGMTIVLADIQTGALDDAQAQLGPYAAKCAGDPVYWRALGRVALGLGSRAAAIDAYRRALALQPGSYGVRNDLAVALIADSAPEEAVGLLSQLASEQPRRQDVALNLDFANAMIGRNPMRRAWEDDAFWSRRLEVAAEGARNVGRTGFAEALLAQALIERPCHDQRLWDQYAQVSHQP